EAADDAHAIAVLTEWDEFKEIDFQQIHASMHRPSFLFDGRNLLDQETMDGLGFEMHAIGKSHNRNNSPSS
ncbi:MAG: UDP binding domain-containing protein, partial [Rubripirellula sp.]